MQDFKSSHQDPWYAIAKLPVQGAAWEIRTSTQAILTINGVAARVFTVGPVTAMCFSMGELEGAVRSSISIKLMRAQDRVALGRMHNRGRWGAPEEAVQPIEQFTATAIQDEDEVRAVCVNFVRRSLTWQQMFTNVFDATRVFRARDELSTMHPWKLRIGDLVLIESIVVRTTGTDGGWTVSYLTDGIFRLARRLQMQSKPTATANPLHVPPVQFPLCL